MTLLDTDVLIAHLRSSERSTVSSLLDALTCVPVSREVAERAGAYQRTYRRSHSGISLGDYLIAATAAAGQGLATLNVRHFPVLPDLRPPFPAGG